MLSSIGIQRCLVAGGVLCNESSQFPPKSAVNSKKQTLKPYRIVSASSEREREKEKMKVVVKAMERPRLVLKFIWMKSNIGIAIDQLIPSGGGTIPVSPYYFWPRKDAWEELKLVIEAKPWISQQQKVFLLNQATDIINLWQQQSP